MLVRMEAVSGIRATHVFTAAVTRDFPLVNGDSVILRPSVSYLLTVSATVLLVTDRTDFVSRLMEIVQYVLTAVMTTAETMATALTTLTHPIPRFVRVLAYLQGHNASRPVAGVALKGRVSS